MGTRVRLPYGEGHLDVDIPTDNVDIFEPRPMTALSDPKDAFEQSITKPHIHTQGLRDQVSREANVVIVTPDRTRVFPREAIEWLLQALSHVRKKITILTGTGSHTPDTPAHLLKMFGEDILRDHTVVSHSAYNDDELATVGTTPSGRPLRMNKLYTQADYTIGMGYVENHFMAGASGGHKAIVPGIADIQTIMEYHSPQNIDSPHSTWGKLEGNPTQDFLRHCASQREMNFLVNFVLDDHRRFVRFDCGKVLEAHAAACELLAKHSMIPAKQRYNIMVTTNKGYPADLNWYQGVKGATAAAEVIEPGGLIISAAECREGFPDHGNFKKKLLSGMSFAELKEDLFKTHFADSWEVLKLANIYLQKGASIALKSLLPPHEVRRAGMEPIDDIARRVEQALARYGRHERVGIIPSGFDAVPVPPMA